jgi:hypothetical protein
MMGCGGVPKTAYLKALGKQHINKSVFLDMIVLARDPGYPTVRPSFFADSPGIQGRPLEPATVALR